MNSNVIFLSSDGMKKKKYDKKSFKQAANEIYIPLTASCNSEVAMELKQ